jgi:exoribonuclease-2
LAEGTPTTVDYDKHRDFSRYELIQFLITMKKSVTGTTAGPHFTMGLSYYTQATSPIRRYLDITEHRLLKGIITGKTELMPDEDEIKMIVATITAKSANAAQCERESKNFWMLRYLEQNMDVTYKALITKKITGGFLGEIDDLCVRVPVFGATNLKIGSYVNIKLKKVSPITGESRAEVVF